MNLYCFISNLLKFKLKATSIEELQDDLKSFDPFDLKSAVIITVMSRSGKNYGTSIRQ